LHDNPQHGSSASDGVTLSNLTAAGSIAVHDGNTSTMAFFGTSQLADIHGNVSINNAVLTIDNHLAAGSIFADAPGGSNFTMSSTTLGGWIIPFFSGTAPLLSYSGLQGQLIVAAGAGDRFTLDGTPASITS